MFDAGLFITYFSLCLKDSHKRQEPPECSVRLFESRVVIRGCCGVGGGGVMRRRGDREGGEPSTVYVEVLVRRRRRTLRL